MKSRVHVSEQKGVRYLHLGSPWVQGAMRIARPWSLELEYTRDLMMPLLLRPRAAWPATVLCIGLGSGSIAKFLYRHRPASTITAVEISEEVVAVARRYFRLPDDAQRLRVLVGDAATYVAQCADRFDLIVVDGFDGRGRAGALDGRDFYRHCRARLAREGMVAVNLLTRRRGVAASIARLAEVFGNRIAVMAPSGDGNVVALAALEPVESDDADLRSAARTLKAESGLDLGPSVSRLLHERRAPRLSERFSPAGPGGS